MSAPSHFRYEPDRSRVKWLAAIGCAIAALVVLCVLAYVFRASLLTFFVESYFAGQGVPAAVVVDSVDRGGLVAHGRLGRAGEVSVERLVLKFTPDKWIPEIVEVDAMQPTIRVMVDRNGVSFGSLQHWLNDLSARFATATGQSRFVSSRLAVDVEGIKVIAATPWGAINIVGNAGIDGGTIKHAEAFMRPAHLRYGPVAATIESGTLRAGATPAGFGLKISVTGDLAIGRGSDPFRMSGAQMSLDVPELRWTRSARNISLSAVSAAFALHAGNVYVRAAAPAPAFLNATFSRFVVAFGGGHMQSGGEATVTAGGSLSPADVNALVADIPVVGGDPHMAKNLAAALRALDFNGHIRWRSSDDELDARLVEPVALSGTNRFMLRISPVAGGEDVRVGPSGVKGSASVALNGRGLPNLAFTLPAFSWQSAHDAFDGALDLAARFDLGNFRGVTASGRAGIHLGRDMLVVTLGRCAAMRVAQFRLRRKTVVSDATAALCPQTGQPFVSASKAGWLLHATARGVGADLPGATVRLSNGTARIGLAGDAEGFESAAIPVAGQVSDRAKSARFEAVSMDGTIAFGGRSWHGRLRVGAGRSRQKIGTIVFADAVKSGTGHATIAFPDIAFDPKGLQPSDLSPLLSKIAQAQGQARFSGQLDWTPRHIRSSGRLDIDDLRFASPIGAASRLQTHMVFTSLLPPETAPDQRIDIARIDWASPLTDIESRISFNASQIEIKSVRTHFAGGTVSLDPLTIKLQRDGMTASAAHLSRIDLGALIAASNLGGKIKFDGKVSGTLPFSYSSAGFRISAGRIGADEPGRLSINPSLWGQSTPNAVESFAYRALENLAFESLSATADSESHGRLRIVFHIKGHSDSPGSAEINVFDLLRGKAFEKNIPLPQGTPIDLTLDTSLNFDELLRGYEEAWSQATARASAKGAP